MTASSLRVTACALACALLAGCARSAPRVLHRERSAVRDVDCREPSRPHAYLYPAENRTDYGPDDPRVDGCALDVPDHLFCCPATPRPTDR